MRKPRSTNRSRAGGVAAVVAATVISACSGRTAEDVVITGQLQASGSIARYSPSLAHDELQLTWISHALMRGGILAVADLSGCVFLLDSALVLQNRLGRQGSGPGELRRPVGLAYRDGEWAVADAGNGRLVRYRHRSESVSTPLPLIWGSGVEVLEGGDVIIPHRSEKHYAQRLDSRGNTGVWAVRAWPPGGESRADDPTNMIAGDYLALGGGDSLYVLDADSLLIRQYAPSGEFTQQRRLPSSIRSVLTQGAGWTEERFNGRPTLTYWPPVTAFSATDDGRLFIGFPYRKQLGEAVGLLVEPDDWTGKLILVNSQEWTQARRRLHYMATDGGRLALLTFDGTIEMFWLSTK